MPGMFRVAAAWLLAFCVVWGGTRLFRPDGNASAARFEAIDLGGLPELRSHAGILQATLAARPLAVQLGQIVLHGAAFNGAYAGPVLRVRPGDLLRLTLVNGYTDSINLHFHGMRVPPTEHGDNMHILVAPGTRFTYEIRIPANHPPGLFWYHDHAPDRAGPHVMAGLSGALLVDGFAGQFAGLENIPQRLMVLKDWQQDSCSGELDTLYHCRIVTMNGRMNTPFTLPPGGEELWRITNQGSNLIMHIQAPGLTLRVVGRDGLPVAHPETVQTVDVLPAGRLDVLARAPQAGHFPFLLRGVPTGRQPHFSIMRQLGEITATAPTTPPHAINPPAQHDLRGLPLQAHRDILFTEDAGATHYYLNGKLFDPKRVDMQARIGGIEAWHIRNDTTDFHEFHIHQLSFQIAAVNGVPQEFNGFADTVRVPESGSVDLLLPLTDPAIAGHIMVHCHVLKHEDLGMMGILEIVRPGLFRICHAS